MNLVLILGLRASADSHYGSPFFRLAHGGRQRNQVRSLQAALGCREQADHRDLLPTCPPKAPHTQQFLLHLKNKAKHVCTGLEPAWTEHTSPFLAKSLRVLNPTHEALHPRVCVKERAGPSDPRADTLGSLLTDQGLCFRVIIRR